MPKRLQRQRRDDPARAVDRREDDLESACFLHPREHRRVEHQRLEPFEVGAVDLRAEGHGLAAFQPVQPLVALAGHGVDLRDDAAGLRFDDLRAVVEVHLVTVVVRRVVAGGDDDARLRAGQPHGKREFGRGTRRLEEAHVAAVLGGDLGDEVRKVAREVPGVVGDDELGLRARRTMLDDPFFQVTHQPLRRAADVVIVHGVGADAGVLRSVQRLRGARLGLRHELADGAPAQSACAERQRAEKTVVEFVPVPAVDQFRDAVLVDRAGAAAEQGGDVPGAIGQEFTVPGGGLNEGEEVGHIGESSR